MIAGPHLLAGLLLAAMQQATAAPQPPPESPGAALTPGGPTPLPSATGDPPHPGTPAAPTEGSPATPPAGGPPPAPAPTTPRITFTLPFPAEKGGGEATGAAGALDYQREDYAVLTGGVELHYQDINLAAEVLSVDLSTKELTAVGHVVIDQGPSRLSGTAATFNLDTKTGSVRDAAGAAQPGIFFTGERIDKVGEDEYVIEKGVFTSCEGKAPPWSFRVGRARIRLEDYAYVRHASMRIKVVPVLYFPYMVWPTRTDRASGLLVPKIGNSNRRGTYLGLAYYKVLGRSWDTTLYADLYSKNYFGLGNEVRYHPSEGTSGAFRAYAIRDPSPFPQDLRWKVRWDHETNDLPYGLRGVVQYENYSDFNYFREFERGLLSQAKNSIYSDSFVSGNWGNRSFNLLVDRRRTFLTQEDIIDLRQLPEVEYKLRPTRLGNTPFYLAFDSAAHYLWVDRGIVQAKYPRFHFQPQLRVPLSPASWLSLTLTGGENYTWYGQSTREAPGQNTFTGETLARSLPFAGTEVIGPSFSRIINARLGPFAKLKHLIEPRFAWSYVGRFEDQAQVPIFDEIDGAQARGVNVGRISLINRLLGKPADVKGGGAREILSLELSRSVSFDAAQPLESGVGTHSTLGPLRASLRSYPTPAFGLRLDADYSVFFKQLTALQTTGNFALGRQRFDFTLTKRWRDLTGEVQSDQGTFGTNLQLLRAGKLNLGSYLTYDFQQSLLRDQRHLITWTGSCYALHLELHESTVGQLRRRDYLFSVDLKNVGTFIDLNGGETQGL